MIVSFLQRNPPPPPKKTSADYESDTTKKTDMNAMERMAARHGNQAGDPVKGAKAMYELASMKDPPLRCVIGSDAVSILTPDDVVVAAHFISLHFFVTTIQPVFPHPPNPVNTAIPSQGLSRLFFFLTFGR